MTENKTNSVAVRIPQSVYDSVEDLQRLTKKQTGKKPTIGGLLADAWNSQSASRHETPQASSHHVVQLPNLLDGLSEEDRTAVTTFIEILRSESQSSIVRVLRFALRLAATEHTAAQGKRRRKSDTVISDTLDSERKQSS